MKAQDVGWRASYHGQQAHFWRERPDLKTVVSLCWMVVSKQFLTEYTNGTRCATCTIIRARENGEECLKYLKGRVENDNQDNRRERTPTTD